MLNTSHNQENANPKPRWDTTSSQLEKQQQQQQQNQKTTSVRKGKEKLEQFYTVVWSVKWHSHYGTL